MDLTGVAGELYALPLGDFTKTRNARAKELRASDKALADAVKALPKPSPAAWVVNQMVRHQGEEMGQVLALGESLRTASADLDAQALRDLSTQRRRLTAAVTTQGRALAGELGHRVTDAVATQVEETLRAAMTDEAAAQALRTGLLVDALSATGIGTADVSASVAVPEAVGQAARPAKRKRPTLTAVPDASPDKPSPDEDAARGDEKRRKTHAEARAVSKETRLAADKAQRRLDKAGKRVARLEAKSLQLQGELEEVRRRADALEQEQERLDEELAEAEDTKAAAEERRTEAEQRAVDARTATERAEADLTRRSR